MKRRASSALSPAASKPLRLDDTVYKVYWGLRKHKSFALFQIRTGVIGLAAHLFRRSVPDMFTPLCRCAYGPETRFT